MYRTLSTTAHHEQVQRRRLLLGLASLAIAIPAMGGKPIRVGILDLPPWVLPGTGTGTDRTGICIDLARELATESGSQLTSVVVPFARARSMLLSGGVEMIFAYENAQLQPAAMAPLPIGEDDVLLISRAKIATGAPQDQKGRRVGYVRGTEYDPAFQATSGIHWYETNNYEQGLNMLLLERLDAFIIPSAALPYNLKKLGITREQLGSIQVLRRTGVMLYVSKYVEDHALKARLRKACEHMRTRQALQRISKRYGA